MKKLLLSSFLFFSAFSGLNLPLTSGFEAYFKQYETLVSEYGEINENSEVSDLENLDKSLGEIQTKLAQYKNGSFMAPFLSVKIQQTRVLIAKLKYQKNQITLDRYKSSVEKLLSGIRKFADLGVAFNSLKNEKPTNAELRYLGMTVLDRENFETAAWRTFKTYSEENIYEAEELIFQRIVPEITARNLVYFIQSAPYSNMVLGYNHKTKEAFNLYYKMMTCDGEPITHLQFESHIRNEMGSALWISLLDDPKFKHELDQDIQKAHDWSATLVSPQSTVDDYKKIISEAAPREIAFVALLKLIKPMIDKGNFYQAWQTAEVYTSGFTEQTPYLAMEQKFRRLIKLLEKLHNSTTNGGEQYTVENIQQLIGDDQIFRIMLNRNRTCLAVTPLSNVVFKTYRMDKFGNIKFLHKFRCDPDFKIYGFEPDKRYPDSIRAFDRVNDFHLDQIQGTKNYSDFFISFEYKVAFFVCLSKQERRDTLMGFGEFCSPGLVYDPEGRFSQEYGNTEKFHGKEHGNYNTDIYYSTYVDGKWRDPRLLCSRDGRALSVNTPFSERSPVLSIDGRKLIFSSEGHHGLGGFDIFMVPIEIKGTLVQATGSPENLGNINSSADEMFYAPTTDTSGLFISNRHTGKFQLHKAILKKKLVKQEIKPAPKQPGRAQLVPIHSELRLTAECIELPKPDPGMSGRNIRIIGRLYDMDRRLLQRARIAFFPNNEPSEVDEVDLAKGDSTYQVILNTNSRSVIVEVHGIDVETDTVISRYTTVLDSLCDNSSKKYVIHQDHVTPPWMEYVTNKKPCFLPFFFETNVWNKSVNIDEQSAAYYRFFFGGTKKNTANFYFVGYADERGSISYNDKLSNDRAKTVRDFFLNTMNYNGKKMKFAGAGKTTSFNNDNWKVYSYYIPEFLSSKYDKGLEKLWFQNRRVLVYVDY
jgi:hypothetical protein